METGLVNRKTVQAHQIHYSQSDTTKNKGIMKLGTITLSKWIAYITGHNNLAYFQNKLNNIVDPTYLCYQGEERDRIPLFKPMRLLRRKKENEQNRCHPNG